MNYIYSYGVVSSSTLYTIADPFPAPEGYAEIERMAFMTGGEATNSSIVLARLGNRVKLDGNWLGDDDSGRRTRTMLDGFGVDTSRLTLRSGYRGVEEVVFTAGATRTIFGTYGRLLANAEWNAPVAEDITASSGVCLDPFFADPAAQVARIAADARIPVVTADCRYDAPFVGDTSAVVISESFLRSTYPGRPPEEVFEAYLEQAGGLVVFTFGPDPFWYGRPGHARKVREAFAVVAVDTAGAGDSLRAGVVQGALEGWSDERTLDFSAALAAIVCTRSPGVLDPPGYEEVEALLRDAGRG